MGILEFFGLGNNSPAPAAVEPEEVAAEDPAPAPEEVAAVVEPAAVESEEVAAEDPAPAPEEVAAAVEPEEVEPPNELQLALHAALIKLDGRLRDSAALQYDEAHLTDSAALEGAITALIHESPHLATTAVSGDIGQGNRATSEAPFNLIEALRGAQ